MNNLGNKPIKYQYTFKHKNTTMNLIRENNKFYSLIYGSTLKQKIFEFIFITILLSGAGFAAIKIASSTHDKLKNIQEANTVKPYSSIFETVDTIRTSMIESGIFIVSVLIALILMFVFTIVPFILVSFFTKGIKRTIDLYINQNYEEEKFSLSFPSAIHSYLHLLNSEVLYDYMNNMKQVEDKKREVSRLLKYSRQLEPGFLKDDVDEKRSKVIEECRMIEESCINSINEEKKKLMNLSNSYMKAQKDKNYKKLEEKVIRELAS